MSSKKSITFILVVTLLIITSLILTNKNNNKPSKVVNADNSHFNVYLEQGVGTGVYKAGDSMPLEDEYTLNTLKSGCIDLDGNSLSTPIQEDGTYISTRLAVSASCYLYYDKKPLPQTEVLSDHLINKGEMWQNDDEYRYIGTGSSEDSTSPKNFICFGTDSRKKCLDDKEKYLYRVIGVFKNVSGLNHVKLLKYTTLNKSKWNEDNGNVDWANSNLYQSINSDAFLSNTTFEYMQNNGWLNKVATWTWNSVNTKTYESSGANYSVYSARDIWLHELNKTGKLTSIGDYSSISARIGLMYASDYALSANGLSVSKESWMYLGNNESKITDEWTIARSGLNNTSYEAIVINEDGLIDTRSVTSDKTVRPAFYLDAGVMYLSGVGTITSPILIDNYIKPTLTISYDEPYVSLTLSKNDFQIISYCFSESNDSSTCSWINETIKNNKVKITTEGIYYMHLKDEHGRIVTSSNTVDTRKDSLVNKFQYTGEETTIIAEYTGTYIVTGAGAQGNADGGKGGYLKAALNVTKGDVIRIIVGGQECKFGGGLDASRTCKNGGGDSSQIYLNGILVYAASGGGAGDLGTDGNTTTSSNTGVGGASATGDAGNTATITINPASGYAGTNGSGGGIGNFYQNCSQYDGEYNKCLTGSNTCKPGYVNGTCKTYGRYRPITTRTRSCTQYGTHGSSSSYVKCRRDLSYMQVPYQKCISFSAWGSGYYDCGSYCSEGIYNYTSKGSNSTSDFQRITWSQGYRKEIQTRGACAAYNRCSSCNCETYASCQNSACGTAYSYSFGKSSTKEAEKRPKNSVKDCNSDNYKKFNYSDIKCIDCSKGAVSSEGKCEAGTNNRCTKYSYNRKQCTRSSYYKTCRTKACGCVKYYSCNQCSCATYNWSSTVSRVSSCSEYSSETRKVICGVRYAKYIESRSCTEYQLAYRTKKVYTCPSNAALCIQYYKKTTYSGVCTSYNQVYSSCATGSNTCVGGNECSAAGDTTYKSGKGGKNYINTTFATLIEEKSGTRVNNGYITITK